MKNISTKFLISFFASLFGINFLIFVIYYKYFFRPNCKDWDCFIDITQRIYIFYAALYFLLFISYVLLFKYLNLFDIRNRKEIKNWFMLMLGMFLSGWLIYGLNRYYYKIGFAYKVFEDSYPYSRAYIQSWTKWLYDTFLDYFFDLITTYAILVASGITNSIWITWWFLKSKSSTKR